MCRRAINFPLSLAMKQAAGRLSGAASSAGHLLPGHLVIAGGVISGADAPRRAGRAKLQVGTSSSPTVRPAATFQHVLRPMEAAAARRKCLVPAADQAWQGASPLQRRLAVATATTLRRPPHPLRRTGTAQHHLSPMRASSAKRDNAGGERARARRKAAWCRCRKASLLAPPAWFLAK